jgi:hypothetical protein
MALDVSGLIRPYETFVLRCFSYGSVLVLAPTHVLYQGNWADDE